MKNAIVPLAIGVAVLAFVLSVYSNMTSSNLKTILDQERAKRFAAEQQLLKEQQNVASLEAELGSLTSKMTSIQKILNDGRQAEQNLLSELEALKKEREEFKMQVEAQKLDVEQDVAVPVEQ